MKETIIYTDLECLISLYLNGDLPIEETIFKYYIQPGREAWMHLDELKKQVQLRSVYPQSSNQRGKK